jgi:hypothetical protein
MQSLAKFMMSKVFEGQNLEKPANDERGWKAAQEVAWFRTEEARTYATKNRDRMPDIQNVFGRRSISSPRSCVSTDHLHAASARRVFCAWVISVQACPAPFKGRREECRFADHPTAPVTPGPQPGRDRSEQVVAINRNRWSQSVGISGRNQSVRAGWATGKTGDRSWGSFLESP